MLEAPLWKHGHLESSNRPHAAPHDLTLQFVQSIDTVLCQFDEGDLCQLRRGRGWIGQRGIAAAEHYRVMYAWRRTAIGWRVAAEMYTAGSY